jgi:hypothetical protein
VPWFWLRRSALLLSLRQSVTDALPRTTGVVGLHKIAVGIGLLCAFSYNQLLALTGSLLFLWLPIVNIRLISDPPHSNRLLLLFWANAVKRYYWGWRDTQSLNLPGTH